MTYKTDSPTLKPSIALVAGAFLAVYVIWGSTYLAIKFAIETIPPFLMAGVRFVSAGAILALVMRGRDKSRTTGANWRAAVVVGVLMLVGGNGLVTFAEQYIASGLAALLIATVPLWLVAFDWFFCRGPRPTSLVVTGLGVGLFGVFLLIGPSGIGGERAHPLGAGIVLAACVFWAAGSLYSRRAPLPKSALTATWMEMLAAGIAMLMIGTLLGEWSRFDPGALTLKSVLAVAYLSVFGSIVALTAYTWLLKVSTPARVGTYAYVNPVVAMALGALLANEPLTPRVLAAAGIILAGVVMITLARARKTSTVASSPPVTRDQTLVLASRDTTRSSIMCASMDEGRSFCIDQLIGAQQQADRVYLEFLRVGSLSMGMYVLPVGSVDTQSPHGEDEVYHVLRGRATLRVGAEDHEVATGSVVYVERNVPHRFHNITEDLTALVYFSPAEGSVRALDEGRKEAAC